MMDVKATPASTDGPTPKLAAGDMANADVGFLGRWISNGAIVPLATDPFPHVVIENFFTREHFEKLHAALPPVDDLWWTYNNPIEVKRAHDRIELMPTIFKDTFATLAHQTVITRLGMLFGIKDLESDPLLNGAGLHAHPRHGRLSMHLDYEKHPVLENKQRRLNIIVYFNKDWKEEYGGDTQLWTRDMSECRAKVYPVPNRAVIFQTTEETWHGVPDRMSCPEGMFRRTLAFYYVSALTAKAKESKVGADASGFRTKATFVKRPQDPEDPRMDELYAIRPKRRIEEEDMQRIWPEWTPEVF